MTIMKALTEHGIVDIDMTNAETEINMLRKELHLEVLEE